MGFLTDFASLFFGEAASTGAAATSGILGKAASSVYLKPCRQEERFYRQEALLPGRKLRRKRSRVRPLRLLESGR